MRLDAAKMDIKLILSTQIGFATDDKVGSCLFAHYFINFRLFLVQDFVNSFWIDDGLLFIEAQMKPQCQTFYENQMDEIVFC